MNYKNTILWKNAFNNYKPEDEKYALYLQEEYSKARMNTISIIEKICNDFPQLTVHDITHVDALWQTGSVITGSRINMNPMEGFILGCAFLMHDAVLSYDAAGGKDRLRETTAWKDFYADYEKEDTLTEDEKIKETDFYTIRFLHAKYAKELYKQLFKREDGTTFYIIEDQSIRDHLGETIGIIASSHHWDIEEVEEMDVQLPPMAGYPADWNINPMKLACILRCADAGHLDAGRAPDYLLKLLNYNGISRDHWIAQNRLTQIAIDSNNKNKVVIKSNISFSEEEYAAWNVAYDAICALDHEIKTSNECLAKYGNMEFQAKGVSGAESQTELSKYIKTENWMPCNANVHISNTERLIKMLGGEKLYGKEHQFEIAIRELVQNSRDAIAARRIMDKDDRYNGRIDISIVQENDKAIVTISDNGIGMSLKTVNDSFLNFGDSFWASDLAKAEYPGLNASTFKSAGRFGIGFFAVFMVASNVTVETRRFDRGLNETVVIKFPDGLCLRPIISIKRSETPAVSTVITMVIDNKKHKWNNSEQIKPGIMGAVPFIVPYSAILANLVAGLDVDVYYSENRESLKLIHLDITKLKLGTTELSEWIKNITYAEYINKQQCDYIESNCWRMRKIHINDQFYGIAALNTMWNAGTTCFDIITINGLANYTTGSMNAEFLGCIITNPVTAKRESNLKEIDLSLWAQEQYEILLEKGLSNEDRVYLPYVLGKYNVDMIDVMLIRVYVKEPQNSVLTIGLIDLLSFMKKTKHKLLLPISKLGNNIRVENYLDYSQSGALLHPDEMLFVVEMNSAFLELEDDETKPVYTILKCIKEAAFRSGIELCITKEEDRMVSRLSGKCDVCIINTKTNI